MHDRNWLVWLFAAATMVGAAVLTAPLLAATAHPAAASLLYLTFSPVCHQLPARSFQLLGFPLALCARCTGVFLGGWLATLCRLSGGVATPPRRRWVALVAALVMLDVLTELAGLRPPLAGLRFSTGLLAGLVGGAWVVEGIRRLESERRSELARRNRLQQTRLTELCAGFLRIP